MPTLETKLTLICGKICSGKSSLAKELSKEVQTILISQDDWLSTLYPEEIITIEDYSKRFARLCNIIGPHLIGLLGSGMSVVLDFPANTPQVRSWMRSIIKEAHCDHELHFLDVSNEVCKARLKRRNEDGLHQYKTSEADFDLFTSYFVPPKPSENFNVIKYTTEK